MVDYNDTAVGWIPDPDNATTITLADQVLAGTVTEYVRYRVSALDASIVSEPCRVFVEGGGAMGEEVGNEPSNLEITPTAGATFQLTWQYFSTAQDAVPDGFRVYLNVASVWTLQDAVAYDKRRRNYSWDSGTLTHGTLYEYLVRTYKGVAEEPNEYIVAAFADDTGPPAVAALTVTEL